VLVGVMSDSHDRVPLIGAALECFGRRGITVAIHAGDIISPFAAKVLKQFAGTLHVIYGNNDGEREGLRQLLPQIQDGPVRLELGGRRVLVHHYMEWCDPQDVAASEIVIGGHNHQIVNEVRGGTLFLNPGECCGWLTGRCTVAVLDTAGLRADVVDLQPRE
jgi:putative phosphoesterase